MLRLILLICCSGALLHAEDSSFCVVELFTSEGCSSCPPADKVVNKIAKQARNQNKNIYVLAFHVDYWDKLKTKHGVWKDPYSNKSYTVYQKQYANKNPMPGRKGMLVTPQLLIDGDHIKNNQLKFDEYLNTKRTCSISHTLEKEAQQIHVTHTSKSAPEEAMLCIALVERGLVSNIKSGENANKTLKHENVVRTFYRGTLSTAPKTVTLDIPDALDLANASVISYIQNNQSMHILAATGSDTHNINEKGESAIPNISCEDGQCVIAIEDLEKNEVTKTK